MKCTQCDVLIVDNKKSVYIQLPKGEMDNHGIWVGTIGKYLWFNDEMFCSLNCFIEYLKIKCQ